MEENEEIRSEGVFMNYFYAIVALLAGLGAFLLGFKLLSENMEKLASEGLKKMFSRTAKSKLAGVGIGALSTAIVQSSSVTTVMVVGFVNAGVMSLYQATAVIMGANIGTTITAQIVALQSFDFVEIAMALTAVGIFMSMFCKKDKTKTIGLMLAGLGVVFMGLNYMSDAMSIFKESPQITSLIASVSNPFLLLLLGVGITALMQSSSAVTSIVISMVSAGITIGTGGNSVLFLILGTNIGTCVTALLSSIGAGRNAKRACTIHLMFNVFGAAIFFILLLCWRSFMDVTFANWFGEPGQQIAMFHTFFNVLCTLLFLPFTNVFVKISGLIVREKSHKTEKSKHGDALDKRFLNTPFVALEQVGKQRLYMLEMSMNNLENALNGFLTRDESNTEEILKTNEEIAQIYQDITDYLIQLSGKDISMRDEKAVSALHHNLGDIVRISEIADNITKYTRKSIKENIVFSSGVSGQIRDMMDKIKELYKETYATLEAKEIAFLPVVDGLEDEVDDMRKKLIDGHIERLNGGYCKAESSNIFINLVSNLERTGDHLAYLAHSVE